MTGVWTMIYTDYKGHLMVDNLDNLNELHDFASSIGLKREWFQSHPKHPHYDLTSASMRHKAVAGGAILLSRREIVRIIKGYKKKRG